MQSCCFLKRVEMVFWVTFCEIFKFKNWLQNRQYGTPSHFAREFWSSLNERRKGMGGKDGKTQIKFFISCHFCLDYMCQCNSHQNFQQEGWGIVLLFSFGMQATAWPRPPSVPSPPAHRLPWRRGTALQRLGSRPLDSPPSTVQGGCKKKIKKFQRHQKKWLFSGETQEQKWC